MTYTIKSKEDDIDYNPGYYNEIIKMKNNFNNQENQRIRLYEPDGEEVGADYGYLEDYDDWIYIEIKNENKKTFSLIKNVL